MKIRLIPFMLPLAAFGLLAGSLTASAAPSSSFEESVALGHSTAIGLSSDASDWTIVSNSNPAAAAASLQDAQLLLVGAKEGFATIVTCNTKTNECMTVAAHVKNQASGLGNVLGASTLPNGQLVLSGKTLFVIYKNSKTGFANFSAFKSLGYSTSKAVSLNISALPDTGTVINSGQNAHPWGSWVKNGSTIYFVHQLGLIPIAEYQVFLNNGGRVSQVLPANAADMSLPVLPLMVSNDTRLQ